MIPSLEQSNCPNCEALSGEITDEPPIMVSANPPLAFSS